VIFHTRQREREEREYGEAVGEEDHFEAELCAVLLRDFYHLLHSAVVLARQQRFKVLLIKMKYFYSRPIKKRNILVQEGGKQ
jgi:hypothetical protein